MDLPERLAGDFVLRSVRRRVVPRGGRVANCPVCGGHLFEERWHLAAEVAHGRLDDPRTATHYLCDEACFAAWRDLLTPHTTASHR